MLKRISMIALVAVAAFSPFAMAEDEAAVKGLGTDYLTGKNNARTGKVELSLLAGSDSFDIDLQENGYGEIGLSVGILPQFAIGGSLGYHGGEVTNQALTDYYAAVGYVDFILRLPLDQFPLHLIATERGWWDSIVPYFKWGVGRHWIGVNDSSTKVGTNDEHDMDTEGASRFAIGVDWFVNPNVALFIEWAQHDLDPAALKSNFTLNGKDLDFDVFGGGIKVVF